MRNTYVRKCNYHFKTHFYQTTPQTPVSADKNLECICSLASNNSDKNAKIRETDAMGVKNAITADKSITTKFNRRHKAALAEGEGFEPPDTDQGVVRFQVECIQPDSANLPNDVFERIFEQSIAWFF